MKGYTEGRYAMQKVLEFIHENGDTDNRIIIKSDGEASIQFLVKEVVEARQQGCKEVKPRTLVEQSPEGCSASDGVVEAAVQEMEGIIRALLIAVEEYLGVEVDARERLIAFIPEYAAYLINRLRKGEDGKTAYERVKGKRPSVLGIEFGEKVWYLKKKGKHLSKIRTRWGQGIFVLSLIHI